jgi:hypothetical protein
MKVFFVLVLLIGSWVPVLQLYYGPTCSRSRPFNTTAIAIANSTSSSASASASSISNSSSPNGSSASNEVVVSALGGTDKLVYAFVFMPWSGLLYAISSILFGLVMIIGQAHMMAVDRLTHVFEDERAFRTMCGDLHSHYSSSTQSSPSPSPSRSSSLSVPLHRISISSSSSSSFSSSPSPSSSPVPPHSDPLLFGLNILRRNRAHLAALCRLGRPIIAIAIIYFSWGYDMILFHNLQFFNSFRRESWRVFCAHSSNFVGVLIRFLILFFGWQFDLVSRPVDSENFLQRQCT